MSGINKNSSSVNFYADNLTKSLTARIIGVLAVTFLLISSLGLIAFVNISTARNAAALANESQIKASQLSTILNIIEQGQLHLEAIVVNPALPNKFDQFEADFNSAYSILTSQPNSIYPELFVTYKDLIAEYKELHAEIVANPTDPAIASEVVELDEEAEELELVVNGFLAKQNDETKTAIAKALEVQNNGFSQIISLLLVALAVTVLLTWFVISKLIRPINRLNTQLTQMLWEQTGHLTERMNQLQYTINTTDDKLIAVRHDLKSPLSNIKGLAELTILTANGNLGDDAGKYLNQIVQVSDRSTEMISNVLTTRQAELELQEVILPEIFDKILQLVDLRSFTVKKEINLDKAVLDPSLMEHALLNLISNARKFSALGIGLGSNLVRKPGSVNEMEVELWVWNDGATISAEDRAEIFKPGRQTADGKKAGGHGLGLSIVKTIAEQHNGRVNVESHEKIGTTFRIIIPYLKPEG
jgi:signal transduction histidine kinase